MIGADLLSQGRMIFRNKYKTKNEDEGFTVKLQQIPNV